MATFLAADRGGSATRFRVIQDGRPDIERVVTHALHDDAPVASLIAASKELAHEFGSFQRIAFGVSGVFGEPELDMATRAAAASISASLLIADDAVTAYLGALGDRPGVVCAIGTGAVTTSSDGTGRTGRVDGWGLVGGDLGSAYWIAESAARTALGDLDGRWSAPVLRDAFLRRYDSPRAFASTTALRTPPKSYVADFARDVVGLAEDGDDDAKRIVVGAAKHLSTAIRTAAWQVELQRPAVALTGALTRGTTFLSTAIRRHLAESDIEAVWIDAEGSPLDGAARLVTGAARAEPWRRQILTISSDGSADPS